MSSRRFFRPIRLVVLVAAALLGLTLARAADEPPQAPVIPYPSYPVSVVETTPFQLYAYAYGVPTPTYHWQGRTSSGGTWADLSDSENITGSGTSTLSIASPTLAMTGYEFRFVATNSEGTATSDAIPVTVTAAVLPTVSLYNAYDRNLNYGDALHVITNIISNGPTTYQWTRDNVPVPELTSWELHNTFVTPADSGTYRLVVTNPAGSATSNPVVVTVAAATAPSINYQHPGFTLPAGSTGANLSMGISGSPTLSYEWYKDGVLLPDWTANSITFPVLRASDAGTYTMKATNFLGSITSAPMVVSVLPTPLPVIRSPSRAETIATSYNYFRVDIDFETPPLEATYQWFHDGVAIPGATDRSYYTYAATAADAGTYALQIFNPAGIVMSADIPVLWKNPVATAPWLDAAQSGDIMYFLQKTTPARIQRYDMANDAWLPVVNLTAGKVPTAFLPTSDGVFIAYGKELVRRSLDLQTETPVAQNIYTDIVRIIAAGPRILVRESSQLRAFNRSTLVEGPLTTNYYADSDLTVYSAAANKLFILGPSDSSLWRRYGFAGDGTAVWEATSPEQGAYFGTMNRIYTSPDGSRLITNAGALYSPASLKYSGAIRLPFEDLVFLGDGTVVTMNNRQLFAHNATSLVETGQTSLPFVGWNLGQRGTEVFAFGAPQPGSIEPRVAKVAAAALLPVVPAAKTVPVERRFSIEDAFLDPRGVIHLLSRSEQAVVRWDTATREFLPSIPLRGGHMWSSYAPAIDRLALAYNDGVITDVFPGAAPSEEAFGTLVLQRTSAGVLAADELTIVSASVVFQGTINHVLDSSGELLALGKDIGAGARAAQWDSSRRRVYFNANGAGLYYDLPEDGIPPLTASPQVNQIGWPLRPDATGSSLLGLNGRVWTADLAAAGQLPAAVTDGAWATSALYTIRVHVGGTVVEKVDRTTLEKQAQIVVGGIPVRIFRVTDDLLAVVTLEHGYAVFHLLDGALGLIASVSNAPSAPDRPATFDAAGYLARNPDVAATIGGAADRFDRAWVHYWNVGLAEGRTDGDFNVQAYLAQYPDLAAQFGNDLKAAALHWYTIGRREGLRIPTGFDAAGYLARNADIAALFGNDKYGAWLHYYNYGLFEGRSFDANFIPAEYLELNQDLKTVFGSNLQAAVMHWFNYGHPLEDRMGRVPIGFNVDSYLARYPDLSAVFAGITPIAVRNVTVWHHYLAYGTLEGRSDGDFEAYHYLATNPDLNAIFGTDIQAAALHWYFYGRREGRRIPGGFNVQNYRALYPDIVLVFGDDLYGSWIHYRDNGVFEGRVYDDLFRPVDYLTLNPDVAAIVGNNYSAALLHWLYYGQYEGRQARF